MDRRQKKTRDAILTVFSELLEHTSYEKITVQAIIDRADVGRTTFYAHFKTKDELLRELCEMLFAHIRHYMLEQEGNCGGFDGGDSVFCHLLRHLQRNDHNILGLLSCENSDLFLRYFKDQLSELVRRLLRENHVQTDVPEDFLVNHITCSFVEMVRWWVQSRSTLTPEQLSRYFASVIQPIL